MSKGRKTMAALLAAAALGVAAVPAATASPAPPTNGGNGAGSSGNCTGNPDDRPASCNSATSKGPNAVPR
jgi:hypothetical protein